MEKFAGYGFNKSHSAAYAVLSYQTAWLKAHHPAAFMAAVLSSDMDKTDKVVTLIDECARMGLTVEPPDVNASQFMFTVSGPTAIRYGLGAIKGVGQAAVENMIAERTAARAASAACATSAAASISSRSNRRVLEALIRAGALDSLGANRATLMHQLPAAMQAAEQHSRAQAAGQATCSGSPHRPRPPRRSPRTRASPARRCRSGARRCGSPASARRSACTSPATRSPSTSASSGRSSAAASPTSAAREPVGGGEGGWRGPGKNVTVAGLVLEIRKRGNRNSFVLDDRSGRIEVTLFEDVLPAVPRADRARRDPGGRGQPALRRLRRRLAHRREAHHRHRAGARTVRASAGAALARAPRTATAARLVSALEQALRPSRGGRCAVAIRYAGDGGERQRAARRGVVRAAVAGPDRAARPAGRSRRRRAGVRAPAGRGQGLGDSGRGKHDGSDRQCRGERSRSRVGIHPRGRRQRRRDSATCGASPYQASEGGGAAFVLVYVALTLLLGIPLMLAEFGIGRRGQRAPIGSLRKLAGRGWGRLGYLFVRRRDC